MSARIISKIDGASLRRAGFHHVHDLTAYKNALARVNQYRATWSKADVEPLLAESLAIRDHTGANTH
jgi:hypothetical protein